MSSMSYDSMLNFFKAAYTFTYPFMRNHLNPLQTHPSSWIPHLTRYQNVFNQRARQRLVTIFVDYAVCFVIYVLNIVCDRMENRIVIVV